MIFQTFYRSLPSNMITSTFSSNVSLPPPPPPPPFPLSSSIKASIRDKNGDFSDYTSLIWQKMLFNLCRIWPTLFIFSVGVHFQNWSLSFHQTLVKKSSSPLPLYHPLTPSWISKSIVVPLIPSSFFSIKVIKHEK